MDLIICFIDDSGFEHDLVRNEIAPSSPGLTFVQAHTFDEARELLGTRTPVLFLLDLWGQDPRVTKPLLTPKEELQERVAGFKTIDSVYQGLKEFKGDRNNEYLKRLFTIVDSWRNLFEEVCNRIGQNRKYGLSNLTQARQVYPGIPAVFYTRKSLISDAVAMFKAGADGLFIKPTGKDDMETHAFTRKYAPTLIRELSLIVDRRFALMEQELGLQRSPQKGGSADLAPLIRAWKSFRNIKKSDQALP
jgi:DNA-binding NarL/FixJ family response regulator